jgi:hypothetical protein
MYNLIIAYEGDERWRTQSFTTYEGARSAQEKFIRAQRLAEINDRADRLQGRKQRQRSMKVVKWTSVASVNSRSLPELST